METTELEITATDFCNSFAGVCDAERTAIAQVLKVSPHKLEPNYLSTHLQPDQAYVVISKIDKILGSDHNQQFVEKYLESDENSEFWNNEQMREYVVRLARAGIMGGLITGIKDNRTQRIKDDQYRVYRMQVANSNDEFVQLIDSDFGREMGFTRQHLKHLIRAAYGAHLDISQGSRNIADSLESGIAVEIATKRYMDAYLQESYANHTSERSLRYGTINEDLRAGDIVYTSGPNTLFIDVKSADKDGGVEDYEPRSHYTPIEQVDVRRYRIRQLHPKSNHSIGEDFQITEQAYKQTIETAIREFEELTGH